MLSARQLLLMGRAGDRAIGVAIAPIGAVTLLPDPDFRRRVFRCVGHVVARQVDEWIGDGLGLAFSAGIVFARSPLCARSCCKSSQSAVRPVFRKYTKQAAIVD